MKVSDVTGGESMLALVQRVSAQVEQRCAQFLAHYRLTVPQYRLLVVADRQHGLKMGELAEQMTCSRGNLTGVVDRLERDGWLSRDRNADDRRVVTLHLTRKGEGIREIRMALTEHLDKIASLWSAEERETLVHLLHRIMQNATLAG